MSGARTEGVASHMSWHWGRHKPPTPLGLNVTNIRWPGIPGPGDKVTEYQPPVVSIASSSDCLMYMFLEIRIRGKMTVLKCFFKSIHWYW